MILDHHGNDVSGFVILTPLIVRLLAASGFGVNLNTAIRQIDNPVKGDSRPGIQRPFEIPILSKTGIGYFDQESNIQRAWMLCSISLLVPLNHRQVRLR